MPCTFCHQQHDYSVTTHRSSKKGQFVHLTAYAILILIFVAASATSQSLSQAHETNIAVEPGPRYVAQRLAHSDSVVVLLASKSNSPPLLAFELVKTNNVCMYPDLPIDIGAKITTNATRLFSKVTEATAPSGLT